MFFKPRPTADSMARPVPRTWSWPEPSLPTQTLWVSVSQWDYKVFPSLRGREIGSWLFQFEGTCARPPLEHLVAAGEIEVLEADDVLGMLSDHWKNVPEHVEGYGFLTSVGDRTVQPTLGFTLYCKPLALDWIYRAFSVGSAAIKGGVGLKIDIDCPNNPGGDFWNEQWRSEWWRVVSWEIYASSQLRDR